MNYSGKVFMLDDDTVILQFYKSLLETEGYETFVTANAYQFILYAREIVPDVIFLDINMPAVSGWEVLNRLGKDEPLSNVPVVMMTVEADVDLALAKGAAHFLRKPADLDEFMEIVHAYCEGGQEPDLLFFEEYKPLFSPVLEALKRKKIKYFRVNNLSAAERYLSKNNPKAVGLNLPDEKYQEAKEKLKHKQVYHLEKAQDVDDITV